MRTTAAQCDNQHRGPGERRVRKRLGIAPHMPPHELGGENHITSAISSETNAEKRVCGQNHGHFSQRRRSPLFIRFDSPVSLNSQCKRYEDTVYKTTVIHVFMETPSTPLDSPAHQVWFISLIYPTTPTKHGTKTPVSGWVSLADCTGCHDALWTLWLIPSRDVSHLYPVHLRVFARLRWLVVERFASSSRVAKQFWISQGHSTRSNCCFVLFVSARCSSQGPEISSDTA